MDLQKNTKKWRSQKHLAIPRGHCTQWGKCQKKTQEFSECLENPEVPWSSPKILNYLGALWSSMENTTLKHSGEH